MRKVLILSVLFFFVLLLNSFSQNKPPVAVNDTVYGFPGYTYSVNLLKNDFDPDGDSIYISYSPSFTKINDSLWEFIVQQSSMHFYKNSVRIPYRIKDKQGALGFGAVIFITKAPLIIDSININNINALINPFGNHFWDFNKSRFEIPKGSGKSAVFNHTLWIGGLDQAGQLHLAAERYRQVGMDFFTGPISSLYDSSYYLKYNRVWKIDKSAITFHINNWQKPGYKAIEVIEKWPAHGRTEYNESARIAPFFDKDENGIYNPYAGDYPLIYGDQEVYFIFNDARLQHTESKGDSLGIEIHGMAYAFNNPADSLLNNTIFMHYDIFNRSSNNYDSTYIGLFTDFDLGYANDDYIGCDVTRGLMYAYNGLSIDGNGQQWAYGANPPVMGMKVIAGPYLAPDGLDNPDGNCDYSLNGLNFGDNIVDNERMGMTNFSYFNNVGAAFMSAPNEDTEYYNLMRGIWRDGTHMIFGGNAHISAGGVGPECKFMFPDMSDTMCNWGTSGILPNGGYNQNGLFWTEQTAGNPPYDIKGVASMGPFTFKSGESQPLDYCFTFARDYSNDTSASIKLLKSRCDIMDQMISANKIINLPATYYGYNETLVPSKIVFYPNPASQYIVVLNPGLKMIPYEIFNSNGQIVKKGNLQPDKNTIYLSDLKSGFYFLHSNASYGRIIKY